MYVGWVEEGAGITHCCQQVLSELMQDRERIFLGFWDLWCQARSHSFGITQQIYSGYHLSDVVTCCIL